MRQVQEIIISVAFFFSQDATFSFFCVLGIVRTTNSIKLQLKLFINKMSTKNEKTNF